MPGRYSGVNKPDTIRSSRVRDFIREHLLSRPLKETRDYRDSALDIGCGWGNYFRINPEAYGIDADQDCVEYLQQKGYKVIKGDLLARFPFDDGRFRCVIAHDVLEHFEYDEIRLIFHETHRVLEKEGLFLILVPHRRGFDYGLRINAGHKHYLQPHEIMDLGRNRFMLKNEYSYPLPRVLGERFIHNKEVVVLQKL